MTAATLKKLQAGALAGSTSISLANAGLDEFPEALYELSDTLEILDLNANALTTLPDDMHRFKKLRILFCSFNQFETLPASLGQCPSLSMIGFKANRISHIPENAIPAKTLRWLIVTDNKLKKVPDALGESKQLQKLMLAGNQLDALPASMQNCDALELLRISANQFKVLPDWLPKLPQLTWLAYAGNPLSEKIEAAHLRQRQIPEIDWRTLSIGQPLGEGASGITYDADWEHQGKTEPVAVKLFKGGLTSDGLPLSEVNANVIVGEHEHLVGVKGVVTNHPEKTMGLVMPKLPADLNILANPPSFESCSRDVYPTELKLTKQQASHILNGVASAMLHMHAKGIMHGDLYAHNILWNDHEVILSDLGGASFLPLEDSALTEQLMHLDRRAFQVLKAELASMTEA